MSRILGLYGAGGCGRGLMPLLRSSFKTDGKLVFIDDEQPDGSSVNGHEVFAWSKFLSIEVTEREVCLGIANPQLRAKLARKCDEASIPLRGVRADNVVEMDNVILGEGACLSPFVTLTSNIQIGRGFHANLYSYVEHDCVIGDFVTFAPGAKCNGNVQIGDFAYIGSNAVIKQGAPGNPLVIGAGAVIGMGAVVTKSVPAGATVVGNPARPM